MDFPDSILSQIIVRHGHSKANEEGIILSHPENGVTGYGLTELGRNQAEETAGRLKSLGLKNPIVITSDFARAKETAIFISETLGCELIETQGLRERYFGELELLQGEEFYPKVWEADKIDRAHTQWGVESLNSMYDRVLTAWNEFSHLSEKHELIWVSHGDTLRIIQCLFYNLSLYSTQYLPYLKNAEYAVIYPRNPVQIASHRGVSLQNPENTLPAFEASFSKGYEFIELDTHFTKDEVAVVIHDSDLNRVAGKDLVVGDTFYDDLKNVDVGAWKGKEFVGTRISTVEEVVLKAVEARSRILLELKAGWKSDNPLRILCEKYCKHLRIMSFDMGTVQAVKRDIPNAYIYYLNDQDSYIDMISESIENGFNGVNPHFKILLSSPEAIREAHNQGMNVSAWTVDSYQDAIDLVRYGIDVITTNDPDLISHYVLH